jgi:thiamine-monophosphate kinase
MIDVSDGLSTDLDHILQESKVSARIHRDRIPAWPGAEDRHVLHGGEEYELIVVAPAGLPQTIEGVPLRFIGEIIKSDQANRLILVDGAKESVLRPQGWQHFE